MNWLMYIGGGYLWGRIIMTVFTQNTNEKPALFSLICGIAVWVWVCLKLIK